VAAEDMRQLELLVGRWRTQGWTRPTPAAPRARIEAVDTYEWLPGGHALLHRVDALVGEEKVEGAEIIGYDPPRGGYVTQYFGNDGRTRTRRASSRTTERWYGPCAARRTGSPAPSTTRAT
jgi:hypothetical protein